MNTRTLPRLFDRDSWLDSLFVDVKDLMPVSGVGDQGGGLAVSEDNGQVYVEAHLPGLKAEEIEVTYDKGVVWVRGQKEEKEEKLETKDRKYYRKASHSFSYRVVVPGDIDPQAEPSAHYDQGVIRLAFAKKKLAEPRKIQISCKDPQSSSVTSCCSKN